MAVCRDLPESLLRVAARDSPPIFSCAPERGRLIFRSLQNGGAIFDRHRDLSQKTTTGDCPQDYLPYLNEKEVKIGICTPCAKNRRLDEAQFYSNMQLDGGPHLIDMAAEAKVFNF